MEGENEDWSNYGRNIFRKRYFLNTGKEIMANLDKEM